MTTITTRTLAAYFYPATKAQRAKGRQGAFELHAIHNGARDVLATAPCSDKREARAKAASLNATPWNF